MDAHWGDARQSKMVTSRKQMSRTIIRVAKRQADDNAVVTHHLLPDAPV